MLIENFQSEKNVMVHLWYDYYPWDLIDIDKYTSILEQQQQNIIWFINIEHIVHYPPYKCRYNVQ